MPIILLSIASHVSRLLCVVKRQAFKFNLFEPQIAGARQRALSLCRIRNKALEATMADVKLASQRPEFFPLQLLIRLPLPVQRSSYPRQL